MVESLVLNRNHDRFDDYLKWLRRDGKTIASSLTNRIIPLHMRLASSHVVVILSCCKNK